MSASGQSSDKEEPQFAVYGFGRTYFVWDSRDLSRSDLFNPANIVVNSSKQPNYFIGAKQTRIGLDIKQKAGNDILSFKLEGDFQNDATDATGFLRMRHAFVNYKYFLVGMTWSNFFDEGANPVSVDFEGPFSSTLSQSPQVRFSTYKSKNVFSLSFENPLEKITTFDSVKVLPERVPDIIAAYRINGKSGMLKVAGLVRELRYKSDRPRSVLGYGLALMGAVKIGKNDNLKFLGVIGTGVAQYIKGASGLNYDAIYNGTNALEALPMRGTYLSYEHFWSQNLHSSLTGGYLKVDDNPDLVANGYKSGYFSSLNIFWEALKNFEIGWESVAGQRMNVNGNYGLALRLQMNATYKFNTPI